MARRKVINEELSQQERVSQLADKHYEQLRKEEVTIEELYKILYRIRKVAAANTKL